MQPVLTVITNELLRGEKAGFPMVDYTKEVLDHSRYFSLKVRGREEDKRIGYYVHISAFNVHITTFNVFILTTFNVDIKSLMST